MVGKLLPPPQSHTCEWVRDQVGVIAALHHAIDKVEEPSLAGIQTPPFKQTSPIVNSSLSFLFLGF